MKLFILMKKNSQIGLFTMLSTWLLGIAVGSALPDPDLGDHAEFSHAMQVETRLVDGLAAVFHYGEVRPDFEAREGNHWRKRQPLGGSWDFRFEGDQKARTVTVPHNWEAMPGSNFWDIEAQTSANPARFNGAGWYRRSFTAKKQEGRRYRLEFLGVRERARVSLNGTEIARHEGLGAPFSIDVTKALVSGENLLEVKVLRLPHYHQKDDGTWEELQSTHTFYPKAPDYWPYAGITGSVALWDEPAVNIRKVQIRTRGDQIVARAFVANAGSERWHGEVTMESRAWKPSTLSKTLTILPQQVRAIEFIAPVAEGAVRWGPESPQLYKLETRLDRAGLLTDGCSTSFGLREFAVTADQLTLNSCTIFLKGVAAYSETESGAALTRAENRTILQRAQDSGANFVRLPVRQRHPMVYQLADELGLMVTGEWGGFWYQGKAMAAQTQDRFSVYQSMARVAVWDLMNRPSVVLWCCHNECDQFCPEYEPFVKISRDLVKEIDGELLPVTWAAWHPHQGEPQFQWADVIGFNEYRGAMDPFEDLRPDMKAVVASSQGKPIVIMENGSWATLGYRGQAEQRGTEEWQADLLTRQWQVLKDFTPPLSGYTFWILQDYRSRKAYTANQKADGWSRMGLLTPRGEPKLAREFFRAMVWSPRLPEENKSLD